MKELSPISKLALDLCEDLGIPYSFGKGFATLDGIAMDTLDEEPLFTAHCVIQGQIDLPSVHQKSEPYPSKGQTESKKSGFVYTLQSSSVVSYKVNPFMSPTAA